MLAGAALAELERLAAAALGGMQIRGTLMGPNVSGAARLNRRTPGPGGRPETRPGESPSGADRAPVTLLKLIGLWAALEPAGFLENKFNDPFNFRPEVGSPRRRLGPALGVARPCRRPFKLLTVSLRILWARAEWLALIVVAGRVVAFCLSPARLVGPSSDQKVFNSPN